MTVCVLEINDIGITVSRNEELVSQNPGFAVLHNDKIVLHEEAQLQANLLPLQTTNKFWLQLNEQALKKSTKYAKTSADIVYLQLLDIWNKTGFKNAPTILIVPGSLNTEQLSLLLGITEQCQINVIAIVTAALVATADNDRTKAFRNGTNLVYQDLQLHRLTLTRLWVDEDRLWVGETIDIPQLGLAEIRMALVTLLTNLFVKETRFDPLHNATTEQFIYNNLSLWLENVFSYKEMTISIKEQHRKHQVTLYKYQVEEVMQSYIQKITAKLDQFVGIQDVFIHQERFANIPGTLELQQYLNKDISIIPLPNTNLFKGASRIQELITERNLGVPCVTNLPVVTC